MARRVIHIRAEVAKGGKTKKVGRPRHVPILPALKAWLAPFRGAKGRVAQFDIDADRNRVRLLNGLDNRNRAHRHSFITYRVTSTKNIGQVALEAGNSPSVIQANYYRPQLEKVAHSYFSPAPGRQKVPENG